MKEIVYHMGMLGHEKASQIYAQLRYFALGDSDAGITPIKSGHISAEGLPERRNERRICHRSFLKSIGYGTASCCLKRPGILFELSEGGTFW